MKRILTTLAGLLVIAAPAAAQPRGGHPGGGRGAPHAGGVHGPRAGGHRGYGHGGPGYRGYGYRGYGYRGHGYRGYGGHYRGYGRYGYRGYGGYGRYGYWGAPSGLALGFGLGYPWYGAWPYDYDYPRYALPPSGYRYYYGAPYACGTWSWDPVAAAYTWIPCAP